MALSRTRGLLKPKQYDWVDCPSMAFSDLEIQARKESAKHEYAWYGAGEKPGLKIWRIVKFQVTDWQEEEYGCFYDGDSYIVLNTYNKGNYQKLYHDVHVWIGKYSTPDEYGTACYKMAELDTFLDGLPVQHREVQGRESVLFRSYFGAVTYLHGGADSGFRRVEPEKYTPRLLHFHGDKCGVKITEVPRVRSKLDNTDVYILDLGLKIYQWNGSGSNPHERAKALEHLLELRDKRPGRVETETLDEDSTSQTHDFYQNLLDELANEEEDDFDDNPEQETDKTHELFRLSDASGMMEFSREKCGQVRLEDFDTNDAFIFDTKKHLFVWIGNGTSRDEKKNAMGYAHKYLQGSDHPLIPVSCFDEGSEEQEFKIALAA